MFSKSKISDTITSPASRQLLFVLISVLITTVLFKYFSITNFYSSALFFAVIVTGFMLVLLLFTYRHRPNTRIVSILATFSTVLAASIIIGDKINRNELVRIVFDWKDVFYWLAWLIVVFCISNFILHVLRKFNSNIVKYKKIPIRLWVWATLILFVLWIPYSMAYFPGILNSDTGDQLSQALGDAPLNNHHPVLIAGFISLFAHLGLFISGNFYGAIAFITIAQMILAACVLGYTVAWISTRFSNPILYIIAGFFFAIFPIVPYFTVTIGKDTFFALSMLVFSMAVYDLVLSKGLLLKKRSWLLFFIAAMILVIFSRNNGIYIIILSAIILSFVFRQLWRYTIPTFTFVIVATVMIQGPIFNFFNIRLSSSAESFGVMIQQIGRTVAVHGDLSTNDKKSIASLMPIYEWGKRYNPSTPDRLKFCLTKTDVCLDKNYLDKHESEFLLTWLSIGIKNPETYIEASLVQNSGFWYVGGSDDYGSFKSDEKKYTTGSIDIFKSTLGLRVGDALKKSVDLLRNSPLGIIINQGALIWMVLFSGMVLIIYRRYYLLVVLAPIFALWLSLMLAAPAMSFRYSLATFFMLPIVLAITVSYGSIRKTTKS